MRVPVTCTGFCGTLYSSFNDHDSQLSADDFTVDCRLWDPGLIIDFVLLLSVCNIVQWLHREAPQSQIPACYFFSFFIFI